jgi:hypothetical protein
MEVTKKEVQGEREETSDYLGSVAAVDRSAQIVHHSIPPSLHSLDVPLFRDNEEDVPEVQV